MKLTEFNAENTNASTGKRPVPAIGVYWKNGLFTFNGPAVEKLKLTKNDQIVFQQDDEDPPIFFLKKYRQMDLPSDKK